MTILCINCGEDALSKCYSDLGRKEVAISGLCEECFDDLFEDEEYSDCPEDDIAF